MTKRLIAIILMVFVLGFVLCGCVYMPLAEQVISTNANSNPKELTRTLYVSGAVLNDGYITVPQLCDYKSALQIAGLTDYSVLPGNLTAVIVASVDRLIVRFTVDGIVYDSVNVNGGLVTQRLQIDGVDDTIVNKLADYIQANGVITNRDMLKIALGNDYADNYYKFYIEIDDYA